jgi:DNA repair exonuclease SbcCD ATPase subunit
MNLRANCLFAAILVVTAVSAQTFGQRPERPQGNQTQEQAPNPPLNPNSLDTVANELEQLRKSVQTLNTRLREITESLLAPDSKQNESANDKLRQISSNFELLSRTEERAEVLRKQLIELIEKETTYKSRMTQIDEDIRPENIERALSGFGTTRTPELRETRRRSLETERKGLESLLSIIGPSRIRLEEDVRQADMLVARLRQRLFPLIERQIDKITPY